MAGNDVPAAIRPVHSIAVPEDFNMGTECTDGMKIVIRAQYCDVGLGFARNSARGAIARKILTEIIIGADYDAIPYVIAKPVDYPANLVTVVIICLLYTSPSPRDLSTSRMPSSA